MNNRQHDREHLEQRATQAELEAQRMRVQMAAMQAQMEQLRLEQMEARASPGRPQDMGTSPSKPSAPSTPSRGTKPRQGFSGMSTPRTPTKVGSARAYVVFRGFSIGVKTQIKQARATTEDFRSEVFSGFPSLAAAQVAFDLADAAGWTTTTPLPPGELPVSVDIAPRPLKERELGLVPPERLAARASNDLWYVCYVGIRPGVYPTWVECAVNCVCVEDSRSQKFGSFEDARDAYAAAKMQNKVWVSRVGTSV